MTSTEDKTSCKNFLNLPRTTTSELSQLTKVEHEQNSAQISCDGSKIDSVVKPDDDKKCALSIRNIDQIKNEGEETESNKNGIKSKTNKVECCEQNTSDLITSPSIYEDQFKITENENANETIIKGGNSLKRTRRTFVAQESDTDLEENNLRSKRKKKNTIDRFCWRCHKESVEAHCSACPRSWHRKCIGMQQSIIQNWICGECAAILRAENAETRSTAMAQLSIDQLCLLLKHVVDRMREYPGSEPFWKAVELSEAPNYLEYVVKPMDLGLLESNVHAKLYGSTDAFMADAKWIQHNCIVFNTCGGVYADTSKLTNAAKQIIKLARQEVSEIEACPDCYAHERNLPRAQPAWFIEPCRRPHPLVWAKLKGFPFWPAKAMPRMNTQGFVDVRFFGEHDRAWVSPRNLYLYSEEPPVPLPRKRKLDMEECVREIMRHCRKLELAFGKFKFAPPKVQYNPHDPMQIKLMLPNYDPLSSNTCTSSQLLTPKKTLFLKKRSNAKAKQQNDSEKADNSDVENKTLNNINDSIESTKVENKSPEVLDEPEKSHVVANSISNESVKTKTEQSTEQSTEAMTIKQKVQPSTSKTGVNSIKDKSNNATQQGIKASTASSLERKKEDESKNDFKALTNVSNQDGSFCRSEQGVNVQVPKKESPFKVNVNKVDGNQSSLNFIRNSTKGFKSVQKVYKPKTRIVDKMNAEKALKSIVAAQMELTNLTKLKESKPLKNIPKSNSYNNNNNNNNSSNDTDSNNVATSDTSMNANTVQVDADIDDKVVEDTHTRKGPEQQSAQSLSKYPVSNLVTDKGRRNDILPVQSNSRDSLQALPRKKESKARKSFSNKARNCPQLIPRSSASVLSNSNDTMSYMATHQFENYTEYQILPPEAGPISARLYYGAQDLARKMAKLMEEAYKEAAQDNQHCDNGTMSDNHQATVHFLRLQIERMRWQHQQQLAELRHNTDRILREMKASLEAERLRAIEETRKEAEDEKLRCIEEIKRKQWCAMCRREALFYCCWNTAYCDYPCQQSHWPMHMRTCAQKPSFTTIVTSSTANSNQQQKYNIHLKSPTDKMYTLSHGKVNEISTPLSFYCSKVEGNGNSS